jgi:hypothetical protein
MKASTVVVVRRVGRMLIKNTLKLVVKWLEEEDEYSNVLYQLMTEV